MLLNFQHFLTICLSQLSHILMSDSLGLPLESEAEGINRMPDVAFGCEIGRKSRLLLIKFLTTS